MIHNGSAAPSAGEPMTESPSPRPDTPEPVADDPEAYLPSDRRRALAAGEELADRVHGAALFADLSGFTPLTETLARELGVQRGPEELTFHLNRIFHAVIAELDRFGGDVIYFSGDAVTCWLDGDDGARATACALAMLEAMAVAGTVITPGGTRIELGLKVAVATGDARRFLVGDPDVQLIDVLAGRLIDALAETEEVAETGEVVLHESALAALGPAIELRETRVGATGAACAVVERLLRHVEDSPAPLLADRLPEEVVRPWLLPAVYERLREGRGELLAELRPAYPVFLRFGGIDYDDDPDAISKLDDLVRQAQRVLTSYGGNLLQLTLGDKGAYLYAIFGSPLAHEDDAARAAAAALELRELEGLTAATAIQIGVSHGRLRSGTYGHERRRTFVCLGDAVNLAARLMSRARAGQVLVSDDVRVATGDLFSWDALPPLQLRGKTEEVEVSALHGALRRPSRRRTRYALPLAGRLPELDRLGERLAEAEEGGGRVVGISAEAGLGKSRLVAEFVRGARSRGVPVAFGECQPFGINTPYFAWREIWHALLGLDEHEPVDDRRRALEAALEEVDPSLVARAPLLASVLELPIPDTPLTTAFDAKLRKTSLETLLATCLRARAQASPLVLVLEDCHWLDELSRDLLDVLARASTALPVLMVLAYRPGALGPDSPTRALASFEELLLQELDGDHAALLIRAKVEALHGESAETSDELVDLVMARTDGNPFAIEELLNYIAHEGVDLRDARRLRELQLPDSLHTMILSRVDTLPESPRRTLKVASVVGRFFRAGMLPEFYPELGTPAEVTAALERLRSADLVVPDRTGDDSYLFKHAVTQEVAYDSLPFAIRADLHGRVGHRLEADGDEAIERNLDLLAHHFARSTDAGKQRTYLTRAGEAAQADYANAAAIDHYERVVPLLEGAERVRVALQLGKVHELVGDWDRAVELQQEALALSEELGDDRSRAWSAAGLAEVARKQGRYDDALELLETARAGFEGVDDDEGVGQVLHLAGTLAAQQGAYEDAVERYEASLAIRRRLDDRASMAALLSNLGVIAEYRGENEASRALHEEALQLRTDVGDRWAIAVSHTNLGTVAVLRDDAEAARTHFEEAMRLNVEVGDAWMVAISHNNLGNANRGLGAFERAAAHYETALRAYLDYEDRWALAFLFEDIAQLGALAGEHRAALELVGSADTLRAEIGSPRAPTLEAELDRRLATAREALGPDETSAAIAEGASHAPAAAANRALELCGVVAGSRSVA